MKKRILGIATLVMVASFFMSCGDDQPVVRGKKKGIRVLEANTENKVLPVASFNVPASTTINAEKAKKYVEASAALMLLGEQWSAQIEQAPDQQKAEILKNYASAREQVCVRLGLAGIAEYNWLDTAALRDSTNASVLKAAGIQVP